MVYLQLILYIYITHSQRNNCWVLLVYQVTSHSSQQMHETSFALIKARMDTSHFLNRLGAVASRLMGKTGALVKSLTIFS